MSERVLYLVNGSISSGRVALCLQRIAAVLIVKPDGRESRRLSVAQTTYLRARSVEGHALGLARRARNAARGSAILARFHPLRCARRSHVLWATDGGMPSAGAQSLGMPFRSTHRLFVRDAQSPCVSALAPIARAAPP